ncbi:MAG: FkbM family methyltransferase [Bacteroidetes bacterium]|nr:FkbM family methyltransferase [Bacteroidota bacterium]
MNGLFAVLKGPVTMFDVGGNIGGYTEILTTQCRNRQLTYAIHVFEPTRSCFAALTKTFSSDPCVLLNNVGVSDAPGETEIFYDAEQSGFASLYQRDLSSVNVTMAHKERIGLVRLDHYIEQHAIKHIDLLKIDIEGHELAAFRGLGAYLRPDFIGAIQFEYGGANLDSGTTLRQIYSLLEGAGFIITKIMKKGLEVRPYAIRHENYQYANFVAVSPSLLPALR